MPYKYSRLQIAVLKNSPTLWAPEICHGLSTLHRSQSDRLGRDLFKLRKSYWGFNERLKENKTNKTNNQTLGKFSLYYHIKKLLFFLF